MKVTLTKSSLLTNGCSKKLKLKFYYRCQVRQCVRVKRQLPVLFLHFREEEIDILSVNKKNHLSKLNNDIEKRRSHLQIEVIDLDWLIGRHKTSFRRGYYN